VSPDVYQTTYPPLNPPDAPSDIIPTAPAAPLDTLQNNGSTFDSESGNIMDYTFEGRMNKGFRSNQVFVVNGQPAVRTDRNYLNKYQWDVIRHSARHFNKIQP